VGRRTRKNKEIFGENTYLECHGARITLLCEGEKGRGAARTAVKFVVHNGGTVDDWWLLMEERKKGWRGRKGKRKV
jgi:hypothetical protein